MTMEHHLWLPEWLLSNGFMASYSSPLVQEFAKPLEGGDSLYVQLLFDEEGKYTISLHSDKLHGATSTGLELPTTIPHAKLLLWFHGITI
jgi:hypothetical protein